MSILISKTFEVVTPESAEHGDAESRGYSFEDQPMTFRELVELIERDGYSQPSSYPCQGDARDWISTVDPECDYQTGAETTYSLHLSHRNDARAAKYWRKALVYCGMVK